MSELNSTTAKLTLSSTISNTPEIVRNKRNKTVIDDVTILTKKPKRLSKHYTNEEDKALKQAYAELSNRWLEITNEVNITVYEQRRQDFDPNSL